MLRVGRGDLQLVVLGAAEKKEKTEKRGEEGFICDFEEGKFGEG
jgi:hypothetical protein